ncbi:putative WD repeat-containing [Hyphodiscus hymeniophilus]|uniref:WD repeat-containing n=1 Tax=Hyphodiscus hymeniophilus TaxID=353542 RepID=A0A9P7ATY6_9HELO|nr:putative WD repeat-containing [Hyphodiscus hymeniophilus]
MYRTSIFSDRMGDIATLTDRINLTDTDSSSCPSSPLEFKPRVRDPSASENPVPKTRQKTYFKTVRFRGRYDGPSEPPTEKVECAPTPSASTLPCCRPKESRPSLIALISGSSKSTNSLRSPDRFLPQRPHLNSASQSYRINRDPQSLSSNEKLLRNNEASPDAFNPRRSVTSPVPSLTGFPGLPLRPNFTVNRGGGASVLTFQRDAPSAIGERNVSVGTVWTVGGLAPMNVGVPDGRGRLLGTGTNAPLYTTSFSAARPKAEKEMEKHEGRLAEALQLDRVTRVLEFRDHSISLQQANKAVNETDVEEKKTFWKGTEWIMGGRDPKTLPAQEIRTLPIAPFKVLDAPNLRDDFYCSVLAYSAPCHTLAVGLGSLLYAWSEVAGVHVLNDRSTNGAWLTSLAFSSNQGKKCILALGRSDGSLNLMSIYDGTIPRFELQQPAPIACITWRPVITMRPSRNPTAPGIITRTEDLLVGDELGNVYYYAVEWPDTWETAQTGWYGAMTLLTRISIHVQQICGLSFSYDGMMFATGGNDNLCCLFRTNDVFQEAGHGWEEAVFIADGTRQMHNVGIVSGRTQQLKTGTEKHRWIHGAAVKAIAFCPWRDGLVATGGGSNDKCIHFFHTTSGASLATISVAAQVTSLIWSRTRREICATFGYASPDHPYRIAVFSWPECKQVAAIPWDGEHRALYAISYPGGPNESHTSREGGRGLSRTAQEGCIVVASSDESVKFHEVWTANQKATSGGEGLLGGSDILEGLEGIDKEGEIIR